MSRVAVSNLAWSRCDDREALPLLASHGVSGVEVAPSRIAAWEELTASRVGEYLDVITDHGLVISSLQAIFYQRAEAQLLGDDRAFQRMLDHAERVAELGQALGASIVVFGAPANRVLQGRTVSEAQRVAIDRFRLLGDTFAQYNLKLGIEPVPEFYNCNFLISADEVAEIVKKIEHDAICVHLDTACVMLSGGCIASAIRNAGPALHHFHAAEPRLMDFGEPKAEHVAAAKALNESKYAGWVAVEMLEQSGYAMERLAEAASFVRATYT